MKTFHQIILNELFDSKIKLNVTEDNAHKFSAFFKVPMENKEDFFEFQFTADKGVWNGPNQDEDMWEILFLRSYHAPGADAIGLFGDMTSKETLATFSGVKAALLKWYNSQKPDYFSFTAKSDEKSRVKLYNKFAKIIAKKLNLKLVTGKVRSNDKYVFSKKGFNKG